MKAVGAGRSILMAKVGSGFEVAIIDHTGMDVIAYHPRTNQRLGITIKSRTRLPGTETGSVYLFRTGKNDRQKLLEACEAFSCAPWIAVYAECDTRADLFLISLENYDKKYRVPGKAVDGWGMSEKHTIRYGSDREVRHIRINFSAENWRKGMARSATAGR